MNVCVRVWEHVCVYVKGFEPVSVCVSVCVCLNLLVCVRVCAAGSLPSVVII